MARVVPSDVVAMIDRYFPAAAAEMPGTVIDKIPVSVETAAWGRTIAEMVERIPDELLKDRADYSDLLASVTAIRIAIDTWHGNPHKDRSHTFIPTIDCREGLGAISVIRQILAGCPDEGIASSVEGLHFITDADYREALRSDVSAVEKALAGAEWKAATVLAGSVLEALLLWALQRRESLDQSAKKPAGKLEEWRLHDYIEVARELNVISETAAQQARIAREFRNLIHPGRSVRLGQRCDKGTALSASAAIYHVVRDLT